MFEIAVLRQCPLLDQVDRHRPDKHRPDRQPQRDHHHVVRQGERADHAIKAERGIEHVEVEEPAKPRADHHAVQLHRFVAHFEDRADRLDRDEADKPQRACDHEGQRIGSRKHGGNEVDDQQQQRDFGRLDVRYKAELAFDPADPMHVFLTIEKERQSDHRQKGPAKPCNPDMGAADYRFVSGRIVEREV